MARLSARCSRSSTESTNCSVSVSGNSRSVTPLSKWRCTGQPARLNTRSIARLSDEDVGGEPADAVVAGDRGQVLEQQGRDALALLLGVDEERDVGVVAGRASARSSPTR